MAKKVRALLTTTDIHDFILHAVSYKLEADADNLLDRRQLLAKLGIAQPTLYKLLKEGLPRVGEKYRFAEVLEFMRNRDVSSPAGPGRPRKKSLY